KVITVLSAVFQTHWQGYKQFETGKVTAVDMAKIYPVKESENSDSVLVTVGTKPDYRESPIETTKQTLFACARKRIWLSSPYFLPNKSTRNLLIAAQQAGVEVRILTTSDRSDKKPVYYASYEVYGSLLKAGIQIFEYQPSMIHAKMLIIDDDWANMGSANLDYRSFLHNDELDIVTNSVVLFDHVEQAFNRGFAESQQIGLRQWKKRSWLKHRVLGNIVRLIQWQL
ncbi:MAG: phospholipase D-like domain-containing protein, partial [Phormidesmis sp.]